MCEDFNYLVRKSFGRLIKPTKTQKEQNNNAMNKGKRNINQFLKFFNNFQQHIEII